MRNGADELRVAILGCGGVAGQHVKAVTAAPGLRVELTVDLDADRARETAASAQPEARWSTSPDAALTDKEVDVVAVCLPHFLHAEYALAALDAGKHVLVEKPMALELADAAEMIDRAESRGRVLAVGQVLRFWESHEAARDAIGGGDVGEPLHTVRHRYARRGAVTGQLAWADDARTSGGLLYGNGSHEMDAVLWMLGERPSEVSARAATLSGGDTRGPTELSIVTALAGGGTYTLTMSRGASESVWEQWTIGTTGSLHLRSAGPVRVNGEEREMTRARGHEFAREWESVAGAIRTGEPSVVDARTVWGTMVALECARLSIERGRPVRADEVDTWEYYPPETLRPAQ